MTSEDLKNGIDASRMASLEHKRKFGGKTFRLLGVYHAKETAVRMAKKSRSGRDGINARVVKLPLTSMQGGWMQQWAVYARMR